MDSQVLIFVNILLTSGVLLALIGAAVKYGRLVEKVEHHDAELNYVRKSQHDLRDQFFAYLAKEKE